MEKHYEVVLTVTGDGSQEKAEELIAKTVEKIRIVEASLGNLQLALTITEKA
jgi:hypothetical protein